MLSTIISFTLGDYLQKRGIHTLLEAMRHLGDLVLYVVGDGPQLSSLKEIAAKISPDKIKFLGPMWGE